MKNSLPTKAERAVELLQITNWLTVIPLKELDYKLNKKEFRDAIKLRYDWEITDTPGAHNELRDLEAEMLRMVCNDVEVEPVLQEVTGETINHGANKAPDTRLDIHARGFWERPYSTFGCVTLMQTLTKT